MNDLVRDYEFYSIRNKDYAKMRKDYALHTSFEIYQKADG